MPIYEYRCKQCEHVFEELVRARDADKLRCPKCDARGVERLLSVFAPHAADVPAAMPGGGCGRCGDPNGPCQL